MWHTCCYSIHRLFPHFICFPPPDPGAARSVNSVAPVPRHFFSGIHGAMRSITVIMDDTRFQTILDHFSLSMAGYRRVRKGVKKRLRRHMAALGVGHVSDYLAAIDANPYARKKCQRLLAVSISRFFRDPELWNFLENRWMPVFLDRGVSPLRVWSAGCANGEEVYSFRMVWERIRQNRSVSTTLSLFGTDSHPACIRRARAGVYDGASFKTMPRPLRDAYTESLGSGRRWQVCPLLKTGILWQARDLSVGPPSRPVHLLFLRNSILTYPASSVQIALLDRLLPVLAPGGLLIIGARERLPADFPDLRPVPPVAGVFQKIS